jgi:putative NIF3 family GTP cyclohydrolase 1 type 2
VENLGLALMQGDDIFGKVAVALDAVEAVLDSQ